MRATPTVIVTTYNATRELELVLTGLRRQSVRAHEIIVADDGSTEETAQLVERWKVRLGVPLRHVWQEDLGYRKGRIVNKAVRRADGNYLAFLDGDMVPHRHWLKDHLMQATPRRVLCGRRARLGPKITPTITPEMVEAGVLEERFGVVAKSARVGDTRRLGRGVRVPFWFAWALRARPKSLMGCNFSLPRLSFEAVNGYDEELDVYWGEDTDLGVRLKKLGCSMSPLISRGCAFHLYHAETKMSPELHAWRRERVGLNRVRCEMGMDRHNIG
ncbi:MAG: glycosyltransferase [Planctomycetota bacterium]|jgi:glycosyltransferase involved in cell wall biosynthesis